MSQPILVSGMRPTGKLHLGHFLGVLRNWVSLQNSGQYKCFFMVADWHSLTTKSDTSDLQQNIIEVTRDFLASGLEPAKATIYTQSSIPQIAELHLLLSMITPNNWVERDPTLKDLVKAAAMSASRNASDVAATIDSGQLDEVNLTYGMLGYPVLQTSDILTFRGGLVPVGKDQEAHLEMSREIARRFNNIFNCEFFPEPKPLFTDTPLVLGVDGSKMSKSFNNDIKIGATQQETLDTVKRMTTDVLRIKRTDPGSTARCVVPFKYYKILGDAPTVEVVQQECESAQRGCVQCKAQLAELINQHFKAMREKRESFSDAQIIGILQEGNQRAKAQAEENLKEIRKIIKLVPVSLQKV
jgi:tryptophanyl-tRNA synthetase